jgi:ABC-type bacteriocin/lantibiotic exporter with double-glycine peptidase domain
MDTKLSPAKRFWMLLKPDKLEITNLYIYAIVIGLLNLVLPIGIQSIINLTQGGAVSTSWIVLIILVAAAITFSGFLQINQLRITENLQQKIFTRAAFEFTYRIPRIKLEELFKQYAPELMNRFFDVISLQKGITKILINFSAASIQVLFGLILLCLYHPFFIVFSLVLVTLIFIIFKLTMNRGLKTSLEESKHKYLLAYWLEEIARSNTTFKRAGDSNLTIDRTNYHTNNYINAREDHFSILRWQFALMIIFKVLVAVGLLLIGGLLVIEQQINIGQFVAAEIVILLIVSSVEKVILSFETIYDVLTSIEKLGQITDLELDPEGTLELESKDEGVTLVIQNLSFTYPTDKKIALNKINLSVEKNERVVFVGKGTSGKSTLLYLISGLIKPNEGSITIEGIPLTNYNFCQVGSKIGSFLSDDTLIEGSLLENITLGRTDVDITAIQWAFENLGLTNIIKQLPNGYETRILPAGKQFSKSTISKLLIARAIVNKPRLLLLENSFSYLASEDQELILNFLLDRKHNWTVIFTHSHHLNLPDLIDQQITLENGEIIHINS